MDTLISSLITVCCSVAASGGFWAAMQKKSDKKDNNTKMLLGLGHDRLLFLCMEYISRKSITKDELENLHEYLYTPYIALGGNGTVTRLMKVVDTLPVTNTIIQKEENT